MNRFLDTTTFAGLGTTCTLRLVTSPVELPRARRAAAVAREEISACERILSRFRPDSDLSRVNASAGAWVEVDRRLVDALVVASELHAATDGKCDPLLLPALVAAGYDHSYELLEAREPEIPVPSTGSVEVDAPGCRVRVACRSAVDLGATAKGFIASRALSVAHATWPGLPGGLVDLGGDIAVRGRPPEGGAWLVDVEDPLRPTTALGTIRLTAGGAATSGRSVRRFGSHGELHHLIDPDTRAPSASGPLAATVVAGDPALADAHATALALTPLEHAAEYVEARDGLGALVVGTDGSLQILGALDFVPGNTEVTV